RAEDVVVGDTSPLLGLDPLGPQSVLNAPFLQGRPQADHVQKRLLPREAANRRPVVRVEVAVDGDATLFGERDRPFDLPALKVPFAHTARYNGRRTAGTAIRQAPA